MIYKNTFRQFFFTILRVTKSMDVYLWQTLAYDESDLPLAMP